MIDDFRMPLRRTLDIFKTEMEVEQFDKNYTRISVLYTKEFAAPASKETIGMIYPGGCDNLDDFLEVQSQMHNLT